MRKKQRQMGESAAWELLGRAPEVALASTRPDGSPLLRVLNAVLLDQWLLFHGAHAGDKGLALGRAAVASVHEVVARIPSHFTGAEKACPATTYYRSAQAEGLLLEIEEPAQKRAMLEALMQKLQPEGGYVSFHAPGGLYDKDLRAVRVFGLRIASVTGKESLGQDRPPERTGLVVRGLWRRGEPGDVAAIEQILAGNALARPEEWSAPWGTVRVFPEAAWAKEHAALLDGHYWRQGCSGEEMVAAIRGSQAWVGAVSPDGVLLGAARAVSDGKWVAQVCDVVVRDGYRGRGIGRSLVQVLLDHPALRDVRHVRLGTQDKMSFYEHLGFVPAERAPLPFSSHPMVLRRRP